MLSIKSETVDRYKGYHYYINAVTVKSSHKEAYVAIDKESTGKRVALIFIATKKIDYYPHTPEEVKRDESVFKRWINRNFEDCIRVWNRLNPKYPVKT